MRRFRNRRLATLFVGFLLALPLAACEEAGEPGVTVSQAWARATPAGAPAGAVYLTLQAGGQADALVGVASPQAGRATLHAVAMDGDIMRMRKVDDVALPGGQVVRLAPGGVHIMLMRLASPLREGDTLSLQLRFATAPDMAIHVPILGLGASGFDAPGSGGSGAN